MKIKKLMSLALTLTVVCSMALPAQAVQGGSLTRPIRVAALSATPAPEPVSAPAGAESYSDTAGHYAAGTIKTWSGYGVLKGYEDGTFRPDGTITRAELATVLDRVMGYQEAAENTFVDLPDGAWYTDYLLRMAEQGVFTGSEDKRMNPNAPITRQETFAAMARALALEESDKAPGFADDDTISEWAKGYVSAMKEAGYIQGDQKGNIRANDPITRAEVVTILNKMAAGFVNVDGTYSEDCEGNLFVNAKDVRLKDMSVNGDLVITDGVADGDVYLEKVEVKGDIILRGCGENSFHILPGCDVKNIIVTKTSWGAIRLVNESGKTLPLVWVNDGASGVTLDGDALGDVVIACNAPVTIKSKTVKTVSVTRDAKVTVGKETSVDRIDVGASAGGAKLDVSGTVKKLVSNAAAEVNNEGRVNSVKATANGLVLNGKKPGTVTTAKGVSRPVDSSGKTVSGSSSGSSSGGSSGSSATTPPPATSASPAPSVSPSPAPSASPSPTPSVSPAPGPSEEPTPPVETQDPEPESIPVSNVSLMLITPKFGVEAVGATENGVGYSVISTEWSNADGTPANYRWKSDPSGPNTFNAVQEYQAVITVSVNDGYAFTDDLTVTVLDSATKAPQTPAVSKQGDNLVLTMKYAATEDAAYLNFYSSTQTSWAVNKGKSVTISADRGDTYRVNPAVYQYQWYQCDDTEKTNARPVSGANKEALTLSGAATQVEGTFYYFLEITVGGKAYESIVMTVGVSDPLDLTNFPVPELPDELTVVRNASVNSRGIGTQLKFDITNLQNRTNVDYELWVEYSGTITRYGAEVELPDELKGPTFGARLQGHMQEVNGEYVYSHYDDGFFRNGWWSDFLLKHDVKTMYDGITEDPELGQYSYYRGLTDIKVDKVKLWVYPIHVTSSGEEKLLDFVGEKTYNLSANPIVYHFKNEPYNEQTFTNLITYDGSMYYIRLKDENGEELQINDASVLERLEQIDQTEAGFEAFYKKRELLNSCYQIFGVITISSEGGQYTEIGESLRWGREEEVWQGDFYSTDTEYAKAIKSKYWILCWSTDGNPMAPDAKLEATIYPLTVKSIMFDEEA